MQSVLEAPSRPHAVSPLGARSSEHASAASDLPVALPATRGGALFVSRGQRSRLCRELSDRGYVVARVAAAGPSSAAPDRLGAAVPGRLREAIEGALEITLALRGLAPKKPLELAPLELLGASGLCLVMPELRALADASGTLDEKDSATLCEWRRLAETESVLLLLDVDDCNLAALVPVALDELFAAPPTPSSRDAWPEDPRAAAPSDDDDDDDDDEGRATIPPDDALRPGEPWDAAAHGVHDAYDDEPARSSHEIPPPPPNFYDRDTLSPPPRTAVALSPVAESAVALSAMAEPAVALSAMAESAVALSAMAESAVALSAVAESAVALSAVAESAVALSAMAESAVALSPVPESAVALSAMAESAVALSPVAAKPAIEPARADELDVEPALVAELRAEPATAALAKERAPAGKPSIPDARPTIPDGLRHVMRDDPLAGLEAELDGSDEVAAIETALFVSPPAEAPLAEAPSPTAASQRATGGGRQTDLFHAGPGVEPLASRARRRGKSDLDVSALAAPRPAPVFDAAKLGAQGETLRRAAGPRPVKEIERLFVEHYVPLSEALLQGFEDRQAETSLLGWRAAFEKSYHDGFTAMRVSGKRPTMVLDAPEVAARVGRLNGARSVQLVLVDGLRFGLAARVNANLKERLGARASLVDEGLLWSALPTVTPVQLKLLAQGAQGLRELDPASERETTVRRDGSVTTLRRERIGRRDLLKLDVVEARLREPGAAYDARMHELALEVTQVIEKLAAELPPRTLLYVFGDHGFTMRTQGQDRTTPAEQGGSSPEEALVSGSAWLLSEVH